VPPEPPAAIEPPVAEAPPTAARAPAPPAPPPPAGQEPQGTQPQQGQQGQRRKGPRQRPQRRDRPPRDRTPRQPREKGPLPFPELRAAAESVRDVLGQRRALRDAFTVLAEKERQDLSRLVAEDGDWRVRARNIAAGSLGAGRLGKAIAAQQISMSNVEDLWALTLSKEEAAERQSHVRNARRRDEQRAQRAADRERRSDRVSRAELEKAQDGRVGATVRIVVTGDKSQRRKKGEENPPPEKPGGGDVLDRLGY